MGNHDLSFLHHLENPSRRKEWDELKRDMGEELYKWREYIGGFHHFIVESSMILVVHAGLRPGRPPEKTDQEILHHKNLGWYWRSAQQPR
ncbi:MAG: hypothetical protein R2827_07870 [Bdellovibrionales bacterium]